MRVIRQPEPPNELFVRERADAPRAPEPMRRICKERAGRAWHIDAFKANATRGRRRCRGLRTVRSATRVKRGRRQIPGVAPREKALVRDTLHDLLLQLDERPMTLPVQDGHVDVEDPKQRVRLVFDPRGPSLGCPRHPLCNADLTQSHPVGQDAAIDACDSLDDLPETGLRAEEVPIEREEDDHARRDELLEGPPPAEPSAIPESRVGVPRVLSAAGAPDLNALLGTSVVVRLRPAWWNVRHVHIAYRRVAIPAEHRVHGLRQLRAARPVDAAEVKPEQPVSMCTSDLARMPDLLGDARVIPKPVCAGRRSRWRRQLSQSGVSALRRSPRRLRPSVWERMSRGRPACPGVVS